MMSLRKWFTTFFYITILICQNDRTNPSFQDSNVVIIDSLYYSISVESDVRYDEWNCELTLVFHTPSRGHLLLGYNGTLSAGMNQSAFGHSYKPWDRKIPQFTGADIRDTMYIAMPTFYSFHTMNPVIVFSLSGVLLDDREDIRESGRVHPGFYYYFSDTLQASRHKR